MFQSLKWNDTIWWIWRKTWGEMQLTCLIPYLKLCKECIDFDILTSDLIIHKLYLKSKDSEDPLGTREHVLLIGV